MINLRAHWLSAFAALIHLTIGLADLLSLFPRFLPPSWQVIYMLIPDGWERIYPVLWTVTGLVALAGIRWSGALRLGFRMSAVLFLSWGVAGIQAMNLGLGGNIQGSTANVFCASLAWLASYYVGVGERSDVIDVKIAQIANQVRTNEDESNP